MRHHGPYRIEPLLPVEPQSLPCSQKLEQKFVPRARVPKSYAMHQNVAYLLSVRKCRTEPQANNMKLNVTRSNSICYFFDSDLCAAHVFRKICERENKNLLHARSFRISSIYSLMLRLTLQPSAFDLVVFITEPMRLPARSGSISTFPPNICAISRTEYSRSSPSPNSSPSPICPTNTRPSTISSTWVKFRFWVPGETTPRGSPRIYFCRKISISVPYLSARSPGP